MSDDARYPVPAADHRVEQTIERSRFICTLRRVESAAAAQAFIREMSAEFADTTHNCWAYVAGPPGNANVIGMSDAGEPHGSAALRRWGDCGRRRSLLWWDEAGYGGARQGVRRNRAACARVTSAR